jgi:hypothetical protein
MAMQVIEKNGDRGVAFEIAGILGEATKETDLLAAVAFLSQEGALERNEF